MLDLGRTFLQSVERRPEALAIVDGAVRLTYGQWHAEVASAAGALRGLGLGRGDHLLSILQNRRQMATLHWACQFLGAIATPLNWRAKADEVEYCALDAEARAVVFEAVSADAVAGSPACAKLPRIAVGAAGAAAAAGGAMRFEDWIASAAPVSTPVASAEDWSLMLYTSGTTGRPKGVPRRHRAERAAALAHVAQNCYRVGERTLGVMPLYHTMGVRSLLSMALVDGCFVCLPRFEAGEALRLIAAEGVTDLYLVPTLYHDLLAHPDFPNTDCRTVTKFGFAGAPMPDALLRRLQRAFEPELLVNHYGSSEIYTFTIDQHAAAKPGSAGRAGLNARVRVVKLNAQTAGDLASPGEEGQIIAELTGDEAFEGYWKRPDADARALHQGWYFTGDTGYVDQDGDLFVTGRVDDMIISGGENISPVEIESVLSLHPAVDEVAVAGLRDERWGQRVVAFVKRKVAVDAQALDAYCQATDLPNFKRPREYVFVKAIPKSPVGKILRRKLIAGEYEREPSAGAEPTASLKENP
ncbi:MAG TPA: AMP-binding protein [Burkholderiales bacterium]|nr:AMP-binding protein [Burkholderiales bacterium]